MFTTTGIIVRLFHDKQAKIASDWEKAGEVNLQSGHAQAAIEDFRNALLYSSDNSRVQLELAEALAAQGQLDEAENYLFNLRAANPENSMINLELARIAARRSDVETAVSFYHDAAFGQWPDNPAKSRVAAREELIEFLLKNNRRDQARAEALSMSANNPADPQIRAAAAGFLMQAGDVQSALDEYQHVLRVDPNDEAVLIGGGRAALTLYDFADADRYLSRAIQRGSRSPEVVPEVVNDRDLAAAAAGLDITDKRLSDAQRRERTLEIFAAAEQRANSCMPGVLNNAATLPDNLKSFASQRAALPKSLTPAILASHPEFASPALDWALAVERAPAPQCAPTITDRAIALIAAKNSKES
jgi:predicted Zn-dependent protease